MVRQYWTYVFRKVLNGDECFGWQAEKVKDHQIEPYNVLKLVNKKEKKNED